MAETAVEIPGYVAGIWTIDPVHSEVSFVVRHMMVSKVRGRFDKFEGTIVTAEDPLQSSVNATVDLSSVNTGEPNRDNHIRSADFFEVESHPTMTFHSTGVRRDGAHKNRSDERTERGDDAPHGHAASISKASLPLMRASKRKTLTRVKNHAGSAR